MLTPHTVSFNMSTYEYFACTHAPYMINITNCLHIQLFTKIARINVFLVDFNINLLEKNDFMQHFLA